MKSASVVICLFFLGNVLVNGAVRLSVPGENDSADKISVDELKNIGRIAVTMNTLVREQVRQFILFSVNFSGESRQKSLPASEQNKTNAEYVSLVSVKAAVCQTALLKILDGAHSGVWRCGVSITIIICLLTAWVFVRKKITKRDVRMLPRGSIDDLSKIISNMDKKSLVSYKLRRDFYLRQFNCNLKERSYV